MKYDLLVEVCSNCKQHAWCTRHNEATYLSLAEELRKSVQAQRQDVEVKIALVGGQRMGSFEVACKGVTLFSKLALGYFPHTGLLTARIVGFLEDLERGVDLQKYKHTYSPVKSHPMYKRSPSKSPEKMQSHSNANIAQLH
jgi:selT/selW/selH-like putative selenoprotein